MEYYISSKKETSLNLLLRLKKNCWIKKKIVTRKYASFVRGRILIESHFL